MSGNTKEFSLPWQAAARHQSQLEAQPVAIGASRASSGNAIREVLTFVPESPLEPLERAVMTCGKLAELVGT
jgi:hypothetical protein